MSADMKKSINAAHKCTPLFTRHGWYAGCLFMNKYYWAQ
jgi:hypothetical protein